MKRRDFLRISAKAGVAAVVLGGAVAPGVLRPGKVHAADLELDLHIVHALKEMITGEFVDVWAFDFGVNGGVTTPGTTIYATEGDEITITVTNDHTIPHEFAVKGVPNSTTGIINPGQTASVTFTAPAGGTYMYGDPSSESDWTVSRVMGLAGVFAVLPASGNTPYTNPTLQVQQLFDDLESADHFSPGPAHEGKQHPWEPERTWVWVFNSVDPNKNAAAENLAQLGFRMDPETFQNGYVAEFFELGGKTGYFAAHDHDLAVWGNIGNPGLIRCLNTGLATHSPHIHGNHVFQISENGVVSDNLFYLDTWSMEPGSIRDMLHPFIIPPDIVTWPPQDVVHEIFDVNDDPTGEFGTFSQFPLSYPMHCHNEISQTAAGGNYPQGLVTHWVILDPDPDAPVDPNNIPLHSHTDLFRDYTRTDQNEL